MLEFKDLKVADLRKIINHYNKHININGISKMSKKDLLQNIETYLFVDNSGNIKLKVSEPEKSGGGNNGYALHAVLVSSSIPFDKAFKEAQDIMKKKKFFHRETKNQYRFRNIPKTKFESKTFKSKKINKDITLVYGKLKPEHMHLEGSGIFDWIKDKATALKNTVSSGFEKVKGFLKPEGVKVVETIGKEIFKPREGFNNLSTKTLNDYGNDPIKELYIIRTPISDSLNTAINLVSLGKWSELKKKYGFDKLFHLGLVAKLDSGKEIIMEKNEVVNITPNFKNADNSEKLNVPFNGSLSINKILNSARTEVGDKKFFLYDSFKNNCQSFVKMLLENQGLFNSKTKDFLFQDLKDIYSELPDYVPKVMSGFTNVGAFANKILGKGQDKKIVMKQKDFIKEHKHLISLLREFKNLKLSKEANKQSKELKEVTGLTGSGYDLEGSGIFDFLKEYGSKFLKWLSGSKGNEQENELAKLGITNRASLKQWMRKNHPDKGGDEEVFKRIVSKAHNAGIMVGQGKKRGGGEHTWNAFFNDVKTKILPEASGAFNFLAKKISDSRIPPSQRGKGRVLRGAGKWEKQLALSLSTARGILSDAKNRLDPSSVEYAGLEQRMRYVERHASEAYEELIKVGYFTPGRFNKKKGIVQTFIDQANGFLIDRGLRSVADVPSDPRLIGRHTDEELEEEEVGVSAPAPAPARELNNSELEDEKTRQVESAKNRGRGRKKR